MGRRFVTEAIMLYLICTGGPNVGNEWPVGEESVTIGRDLGNTILLLDPHVSRLHCRVFKQSDTYFLEDLGSTNGTFLLDKKIHAPTPLDLDSVFRVGESVLLFTVTNLKEHASVCATEAAFGPGINLGHLSATAQILKEPTVILGRSRTT